MLGDYPVIYMYACARFRRLKGGPAMPCAKERDVLHDAGCFHNQLSDTTSRARTNCSACLLPRYYPRLTRCVASLLPLSQRAACELSGVGVTARQLEPRCAARARRRPRVHVPHAARTEERTRNVSRTDPAVGRAREGSRARRDGTCGAPKQADSKLVGVVVQLRAPCPHPCKCIRRS